MAIDPSTALIAIFGMALITFVTRAGGLWVMGYVPLSPGVESFLRHMASSVIVAIVVTQAWRGDWAMRVAIGVSVAVMLMSRSTMVALFAGMLSAAAWRAIV